MFNLKTCLIPVFSSTKKLNSYSYISQGTVMFIKSRLPKYWCNYLKVETMMSNHSVVPTKSAGKMANSENPDWSPLFVQTYLSKSLGFLTHFTFDQSAAWPYLSRAC